MVYWRRGIVTTGWFLGEGVPVRVIRFCALEDEKLEMGGLEVSGECGRPTSQYLLRLGKSEESDIREVLVVTNTRHVDCQT